MEPLFAEGEVVKEKETGRVCLVKGILITGPATFYNIVDAHGTEPFRGNDIVTEDKLEKVED